MKAKEYYDKYISEGILLNKAKTIDLLDEFVKDTVDLLKKRKCSRDEAVVAVVREQNKKWNALVRIFRKNTADGYSPVVEDGLARYFIRKVPALGKYMKEVIMHVTQPAANS